MDEGGGGARPAGGYYTNAERVRAAMAFAAHKYGFVSIKRAWRAAFRGTKRSTPRNPGDVGQRWYNQLLRVGNVLSAPRGRLERKMSDELAAEAAALVKEGYVTTVRPQHGEPFEQGFFFGSVAQALRLKPRLREIMQKAGVSQEHLVRRMHEVDEHLMWGPVEAKPPLKPALVAERQAFAQDMLQKHAEDPHFLQRILFLDEFKPVLMGGTGQAAHAWHDLQRDGRRPVLGGVLGAGEPPCHVHAYVGATGDLGLVAFQYTHGTTGFPHNWPPVPLDSEELQGYYTDPAWQVGAI